MPEDSAATPGWVDERLDTLFAVLPASGVVSVARHAYLACLASRKPSSVPSDTLGAEFTACRTALHQALRAGGFADQVAALDEGLEALEAEIASES